MLGNNCVFLHDRLLPLPRPCLVTHITVLPIASPPLSLQSFPRSSSSPSLSRHSLFFGTDLISLSLPQLCSLLLSFPPRFFATTDFSTSFIVILLHLVRHQRHSRPISTLPYFLTSSIPFRYYSEFRVVTLKLSIASVACPASAHMPNPATPPLPTPFRLVALRHPLPHY